MLGRILCLLGLHQKVLAKAPVGPEAGDIYACRCARPTCKWSAATDLRPERPPGAAVGGAVAGGKLRF